MKKSRRSTLIIGLWALFAPPLVSADPVVLQQLQASSFLTEDDYFFHYHPFNAFDHDPATAWVEGAGNSGIDEKISVYFNDRVTVDEIRIANGFFNAQWFEANNRVKDIRIELDSYSFQTLLGDGMTEKSIRLSAPKTFYAATFQIKSVYRGTRFDDTCIAELRFFNKGQEIIFELSDLLKEVQGLPPGPNTPAGKKIIEATMAGVIVEYFFSDRTYLQTFGDEFYRVFGTWELVKNNTEILIHRNLYCYLKGTGPPIYAAMDPLYPEYDYVEEKIDYTFSADWPCEIWSLIGESILPLWEGRVELIDDEHLEIRRPGMPDTVPMEIERRRAEYAHLKQDMGEGR